MSKETGRSGADRLAQELREDPPSLDEVSQARMEKGLLAALRSEAAAFSEDPPRGTGSRVKLPDDRKSSVPEPRTVGGGRRLRVLGGALALAAAAALTFWFVGGQTPSASELQASYRLYEGGETLERGPVVLEQEIETRRTQRVQVVYGPAQVDVTPHSRARFVRVDEGHIRLALATGAVEVEFHPKRRGSQTLRVDTQQARVEVVGTIFRVEAKDGITRVSVQDGTVRVVPWSGAPRLVHAGQSITVGTGLPAEEVEDPSREGSLERSANEVPPPLAPSEDLPSTGVVAASSGMESASLLDVPVESPEQGATVDEEMQEASEGAASTGKVRPLPYDIRFEFAERLQREAKHRRSRHLLYQIARVPARRMDRVRAWSLIAESYAAQSNLPNAAEAYRRAATAGHGTTGGYNALFALARLTERQIRDRPAARAAYRRYLAEAPDGPHVGLAERALCRLGDQGHCPE